MMKLRTYAGLSLIATLAVIYHSFNSRGHFYPAMVYLSTSKISLVLLLNMGLVIMCILWQLTKKIFLGSLREAEIERLNEQSWREIMEILFAITIFRQDFSVTFLGMVTALLLIKSLHWLAQKRVEYIETTPSVPLRSHIRIVSFLGFLLIIDSIFLYNSVKYLLETRQASVSLFFSFEYMILATTTVSTFIKYVFYVSDMLMEGQWEKKAVYTFYLELVRDLLHLTMYMCFFLVIFVSDATCIICREEMTTAKKLLCGHLFHVHCLRSWLERQNTCPTCRALVVPSENGTSTSGSRADGHQQGVSASGSSSQTSPAGDGVANDNVSQHQARLQAAAAAAAIYEKSFVYPSPNTLMWSPGYALLPQTFEHSSSTVMATDASGASTSGLPQQYQFLNTTFAQSPQCTFVPSQFLGFKGQVGTGSATEAPVDLQMKMIENQIEFLQQQLQHLQASNGDKTMDQGSSDVKGKSVSSPSSSVVDSSETGNQVCTA
ncbi:ERAD-associated E3 ubiquitin-protein ligase HRD1B-like isoform X2 [Henckelia pumila]|uniref:ERAD-associated E3 ubiquitin-protein ligase HRD1B-like isoform X2 n=1 Tax=Henckelia pumila TaxID=405737 RepID=UPI003C6E9A08